MVSTQQIRRFFLEPTGQININ